VNTTNGSWWIVKVLPTTESKQSFHALANDAWIPQFKIRAQAREVLRCVSSRLDLNHPPTAVGGICVSYKPDFSSKVIRRGTLYCQANGECRFIMMSPDLISSGLTTS